MTPFLSATSHPVKHQHLVEGSVASSNFVGKNVTKSSVENNIIQRKIRQLQKEGREFKVRKCSDILSAKTENMVVKEELEPSPAKRIRLHADTVNEILSDTSVLLYRSKGEKKTSIVNFHVIMN